MIPQLVICFTSTHNPSPAPSEERNVFFTMSPALSCSTDAGHTLSTRGNLKPFRRGDQVSDVLRRCSIRVDDHNPVLPRLDESALFVDEREGDDDERVPLRHD